MTTRLTKRLTGGRAAAKARNFSADEGGAIAIVAAFAIPAVIAMVALAVEFGRGLLIRDETQVVADEAAYAGALAYAATGNASSIQPAAQSVASLNGVAASEVTANLLASSPRDAASQAVEVTITTSEPIVLGQVIGFGSDVTIDATSTAELPAGPSPCILALNAAGSGVTLSGGTSISAPNCAVASQASIAVPCGDSITAKDLYYDGSAPTVGCAGISGPVKKVSSADPLASNAGVVAANARALADESLASPTIPSAPTGGANITFGYTQYPPAMPAGCTASGSPWGGNWAVTCIAGGTYNFGSLTVSGGTVAFSGSGSYNFSGTVTNDGSLTFGAGTFNMAGGLVTGGGTTTIFGAGTFYIGKGPSCSGANYSICHTGSTLTFGGPSTFVLTSGIYNSGGETITFGAGSTNSYQIGPSSNGYAFNVGGGSTTTFADATGSSSVFQMVGNLTESGGSCITLPSATNHDIEGSVNLMGGLTLGSGLYAVSGSFLIGASGGGDVWCSRVSANVGVSGVNVTIAVAGSGAASNAFVIGAGFSHVTLSAPTSGTYENVTVVGPLSASATGGILLTEGASQTTIGGSIYFPNGPMTLNGGASVGAGAGQCLEIVASQITLSGGTSIAAAPCFAASGAQGAPLLIQ